MGVRHGGGTEIGTISCGGGILQGGGGGEQLLASCMHGCSHVDVSGVIPYQAAEEAESTTKHRLVMNVAVNKQLNEVRQACVYIVQYGSPSLCERVVVGAGSCYRGQYPLCRQCRCGQASLDSAHKVAHPWAIFSLALALVPLCPPVCRRPRVSAGSRSIGMRLSPVLGARPDGPPKHALPRH